MKFPAKGTTILLGAWLVIMATTLLMMSFRDRSMIDELGGVLLPMSVPIESVALIDQHRDPFTISRLSGKWTFLFFGYTYCPDICPTTLVTLRSLAQELNARGIADDDFQMVFVSVDPERDTPEQIANYLESFGGRLIGTTGQPDEIHSFAKQLGAMYYKEEQTSPDGYLVSHASSIFLIDPRVKLLATFSPPHDHQTIANLFETIHRASL